MKNIALLFLLSLLTSCGPKKDPRIYHGPPYEERSEEDPSWEKACAAADARLRTLNCEEAQTPTGRSYKDVCMEKMNAKEGAIPFAPRCTSTISSCEEIETKCNK